MAANKISINIFNFGTDINRSKRSKSRSINAPLEDIYSGKILKIMRVGGIRVKLQKNFTLGEFVDYTVSHQIADGEYKIDFHSKNIDECVDYIRSMNCTVFEAVNSILENYNKIEKKHKQYEKMQHRKNKMAYPNE